MFAENRRNCVLLRSIRRNYCLIVHEILALYWRCSLYNLGLPSSAYQSKGRNLLTPFKFHVTILILMIWFLVQNHWPRSERSACCFMFSTAHLPLPVFKALMKQNSPAKYWGVVFRLTLGCKIVWNLVHYGKRKQQMQTLASGFEGQFMSNKCVQTWFS